MSDIYFVPQSIKLWTNYRLNRHLAITGVGAFARRKFHHYRRAGLPDNRGIKFRIKSSIAVIGMKHGEVLTALNRASQEFHLTIVPRPSVKESSPMQKDTEMRNDSNANEPETRAH